VDNIEPGSNKSNVEIDPHLDKQLNDNDKLDNSKDYTNSENDENETEQDMTIENLINNDKKYPFLENNFIPEIQAKLLENNKLKQRQHVNLMKKL